MICPNCAKDVPVKFAHKAAVPPHAFSCSRVDLYPILVNERSAREAAESVLEETKKSAETWQQTANTNGKNSEEWQHRAAAAESTLLNERGKESHAVIECLRLKIAEGEAELALVRDEAEKRAIQLSAERDAEHQTVEQCEKKIEKLEKQLAHAINEQDVVRDRFAGERKARVDGQKQAEELSEKLHAAQRQIEELTRAMADSDKGRAADAKELERLTQIEKWARQLVMNDGVNGTRHNAMLVTEARRRLRDAFPPPQPVQAPAVES